MIETLTGLEPTNLILIEAGLGFIAIITTISFIIIRHTVKALKESNKILKK